MMSRASLHVSITGRVQGVGYRAFVEGEAVGGLWGWVRNRRDGSVEAVFSGEAEVVEAMIEACRRGPRHAVVEAVTVLGEAEPQDGPFLVVPSL